MRRSKWTRKNAAVAAAGAPAASAGLRAPGRHFGVSGRPASEAPFVCPVRSAPRAADVFISLPWYFSLLCGCAICRRRLLALPGEPRGQGSGGGGAWAGGRAEGPWEAREARPGREAGWEGPCAPPICSKPLEWEGVAWCWIVNVVVPKKLLPGWQGMGTFGARWRASG